MKNLYRTGLLLALAVCLCNYTRAQQTQAGVNICVNVSKPVGDMKPIWAWFGHDEPNYTYMKDGRKLLTELSQLSPVPVYMRVHNLMTSGDGTPALKWGSTNIYTEDAKGNPIYNYRIVDSIFDTYIKRGMKPLAQLGFMPEALSTHPQPYQHHWKPGVDYKAIETGWAYPPKDYKKWGDLIYNWVKHSVSRYGAKEVASWYWEVWNEPDGAYWKGTPAEFYKLYDYAADGVKRALPAAQIGGCNVTGGGMKFLTGFLNHCLKDTNFVTGKIGSPLNAVLFHAKGSPRINNGQVRMGISNQLRNMNNMFKLISAYPQLKDIPVIIGESDPEGCAACGISTNPENAYRNGTLYSSYTAASFSRAYLLADQYHINLIGAVSWSFEFEDQPWFAGFRDLATNGVDKPVLNVFRMFGMMKGQRVEVQNAAMYETKLVVDSGIRKQADIGALASADSKTAAVMLWNYHDEDNSRTPHKLLVHLNNIPAKSVTLARYLIDWDHSNSYEVWKKMGSPESPTLTQIAELEKAGMLKMNGKPAKLNTNKGSVFVKTTLQAQAVELVKIDW
jgi:xylan 1,4-beta-xylosidase